MDRAHRAAITAVNETISASRALQENLRRGEVMGRKMVATLEKGVAVSASVGAAGGDSAVLRQNTNDCLAEFERCRHKMRIAFIGFSLDEGMTIGDIGRTLGISRQLASRFAREARGEC